MKILVLGTTGLIGRTVFEELSLDNDLKVLGTSRSSIRNQRSNLNLDYAPGSLSLRNIIENNKPEFIINCIGITKHLKESKNSLTSISVNSLLPHEIVSYCSEVGSKLIQISTDCVFSGSKGNYIEGDVPDSQDLYGRSKFLGEVVDEKHLTIRTSTIGHEHNSKFGLLEWFLGQQDSCFGYKNAIFSGLTTIELSKVLREVISNYPELNGLYHVAGKPINKFDLLKIISRIYNKNIIINPDYDFHIDRSLNPKNFQNKTGYLSPSWEEMIDNMYKNFKKRNNV